MTINGSGNYGEMIVENKMEKKKSLPCTEVHPAICPVSHPRLKTLGRVGH